MADRSLRGMSIGSKSMETDEGVDFAPRFQAHYDCPNGHTIILPFSTEAEVPVEWECRCGELALLRDADRPEPKETLELLSHGYDPIHGGFGRAPKFPPTTVLDALLVRGDPATLDQLSLSALSDANALAVVPEHQTFVQLGERVNCLVLEG